MLWTNNRSPGSAWEAAGEDLPRSLAAGVVVVAGQGEHCWTATEAGEERSMRAMVVGEERSMQARVVEATHWMLAMAVVM